MIETGIYFDETHSYYDLNLILSKSEIPPAKPKTSYVDIPGADGSLDLTESNGEVRFSDRECTFTFTVNPFEESTWEEKKTEISNLLNGKKVKITLDKDDEFYYFGRCTVDDYASDKRINKIVIVARVNPYKFKKNVTILNVEISETPKIINIMNSRKTVSPSITCTNDNTVVVFGGATYNMGKGTHKFLDIQFAEGNNTVTVSGEGAVTFEFQEGEL